MKKYKLVKCYPGCPALGTILEPVDTALDLKTVLKYPEFWEEIIDKNYAILSFKYNEELSTLRDNGYYVYEKVQPKDCPNGKGATLEEMLDEEEYPGSIIHSVIRLSDSKIFTIEDKIDADIFKNKTILGFKSYDNYKNIWVVTFHGSTPLHLVQSSNAVIFTTDDGVDIHKGDDFFFVDTFFTVGKSKLIANKFTKIKEYKHFSTRQVAEDYVTKNKPLFVTEDGVEIKEGDEYIYLSVIDYSLGRNKADSLTDAAKGVGNRYSKKYFSTKAKAQEYIDMNKPRFSKQDIINSWGYGIALEYFIKNLEREIIR